MKFAAALLFSASAALALQARQVDEQKLESLSFIAEQCRGDCQVIKDAYHDAKDLQCNAQSPSDECFKAMCGVSVPLPPARRGEATRGGGGADGHCGPS